MNDTITISEKQLQSQINYWVNDMSSHNPLQVLYEISVDKEHKQCVQAAIYCQTRAYDNIPQELSKSALALALLEHLPAEDRDYIAQIAFRGNESMLLPDGTIEESEVNEE